MAQVEDYNMVDFSGGLNLKDDAFNLRPGESPGMLNMDIDAQGGIVARKGWLGSAAAGFSGGADARTLFVHELADGTDNCYLANYVTTDCAIHKSADNGETWTLQATLTADCDPHGADFAAWGDTAYMCAGVDLQSVSWDDAQVYTTIATLNAGTYSPVTTPVTAFPRCEVIASHQGYMFAANTHEVATEYHPHRIRWSHPNDPEAWAETDYIDIVEGGGPIKAIVPMSDHLLIFKPSSIWALYGYDADSWQLVNVSHDVGTTNRQAVCRSEKSCYFYSHPRGVFQITAGQYPIEVSDKISPIFENGDIPPAETDQIWLGWMADRLWVALPWDIDTAATDATVNYIYHPEIQGGVWVVYEGQWDATTTCALGPFAQGGYGGGESLKLANCRNDGEATGRTVVVDSLDNAGDNIENAGVVGYEAYYRTHWLYMGKPSLKKRWRRPDFIAKEYTDEWDLTIDLYVDYNETNIKRTRTIVVDAGSTGALWNAFNWGDGTLYGQATEGSRVEKGGSLGPAKAVALELSGESALPWGIDGIVFKFTPRRMR